MNDILLILVATGIFFGIVALRGFFGYLKNNKANPTIVFNKEKFWKGSLWIALKTASIGALAGLMLALVWVVKSSGLDIAGLEQVSTQTLLVGILIADITALGFTLKEALGAIFGLSEAQIAQIQETASSLDGDSGLGIKIEYKDGEVVASAETVTTKTSKEQFEEDGVEIDDGIEVEIEEEAGRGGANTYVEPYRSARADSLVDPSTCYNRECVSYVACKIMQVRGSWPARTGDMNAKNWIHRLPSWGYRQVSAPQDGGKYVGVTQAGKYGHVLWHEYGNTISEYNYASRHSFGMRAINLSQYTWYEIAPPPTPTPAPQPQPTHSGNGRVFGYGYITHDPLIGRVASFLRKNYPAYTPASALGNSWGPNIQRALTEFQRRTGILADGRFTERGETMQVLKRHGFKG